MIGIAGGRLHELQIKFALSCGLPVRTAEVVQLARDVQLPIPGSFAVRRELHRSQIDGIAGEVGRCLDVSLDRRSLGMTRLSSREVKVTHAGVKVVAFLRDVRSRRDTS